MPKYKIYHPGDGYLLGEFRKRIYAEQCALVLDEKKYKNKKAYENAKKSGALHQVREVPDGQEAG